MRRGVSNAISAVFVIALLLSIAYMSISAIISNAKAISKAQKRMVDHEILRSQIHYGKIFVDGNKILIGYDGTIGEYAIRLVCMDSNTHTKLCVVPTTDDRNAISYWDPEYEINMTFYVNECPNDLWKDLNTDGLLCYIIGEASDEERYIRG